MLPHLLTLYLFVLFFNCHSLAFLHLVTLWINTLLSDMLLYKLSSLFLLTRWHNTPSHPITPLHSITPSHLITSLHPITADHSIADIDSTTFKYCTLLSYRLHSIALHTHLSLSDFALINFIQRIISSDLFGLFVSKKQLTVLSLACLPFSRKRCL